MKGKMTYRVRLVLAVLATLLEEAALVVLVLWGLPQLGINIPLPGLITLMTGLVVLAVFTFRLGTRALLKKPVGGLSTMIGSEARVVKSLAPEGMVRIKGELWEARSIYGEIGIGEAVSVVGQDGLKLIVRKSSPGDSKEND
jgi:membrane protein implicated in regulation of membrane protease activity